MSRGRWREGRGVRGRESNFPFKWKNRPQPWRQQGNHRWNVGAFQKDWFPHHRVLLGILGSFPRAQRQRICRIYRLLLHLGCCLNRSGTPRLLSVKKEEHAIVFPTANLPRRSAWKAGRRVHRKNRKRATKVPDLTYRLVGAAGGQSLASRVWRAIHGETHAYFILACGKKIKREREREET